MSGDHNMNQSSYGDGNVYRGQRSKDSTVKTITWERSIETFPESTDPDPALLKIQQDREKAAPMPAHIRQQINSVLRKV